MPKKRKVTKKGWTCKNWQLHWMHSGVLWHDGICKKEGALNFNVPMTQVKIVIEEI